MGQANGALEREKIAANKKFRKRKIPRDTKDGRRSR